MYAHPLLITQAAEIPALLRPRAIEDVDGRRRKILVPLDGTAISEAALDHVIALARSMPIAVHLLNVQAPVMAGDINLFTTAAMVQAQRRTAGELALKRARGTLSAARIEHTVEIASGSAATAIVRSAAVHGCSKIVMATRNNGLLDALLRPSVARRVLRLAAVPVTVVKASPFGGVAATRSAERVFSRLRALCSWRKRSCAPSRAYQAS